MRRRLERTAFVAASDIGTCTVEEEHVEDEDEEEEEGSLTSFTSLAAAPRLSPNDRLRYFNSRLRVSGFVSNLIFRSPPLQGG